MKSLVKPGILIVLIWIILYPSCSSDPTPSPTDNREKYIGTWSVSEAHTKSTPFGDLKLDIFYQVKIYADQYSATAVYISNFANAGQNVTAHAETNGNAIYLSPSNQTLSTGWIVDGSGSYSNSQIVWNFTINDGADLIYATAKYTK